MSLFNAPLFADANLTPPKFMSHITSAGGFLPDLPGAHACWYYCRMATESLKKIKQGADYQGELDHIDMFNNLARSVALLYRLDSPDDFLLFMPYVEAEAMRMDLYLDPVIKTPGTHTHITRN